MSRRGSTKNHTIFSNFFRGLDLIPNHGKVHILERLKTKYYDFFVVAGLKVNDQLVAYATRFLAVRLKNHVWSHHGAFKAKVQCDFSSAYSPNHTNVLRLINII